MCTEVDLNEIRREAEQNMMLFVDIAIEYAFDPVGFMKRYGIEKKPETFDEVKKMVIEVASSL